MDRRQSVISIMRAEGSCLTVDCSVCVFQTKDSKCRAQQRPSLNRLTDYNAERLAYVKMLITNNPEEYMEYLL